MPGVIVGPGRTRVRRRRPLPTLPLPAGAKVMCVGHSAENDYGFTGSNDNINPPLIAIANRTIGEIPWMRGLDTRFNFDTWPDMGAPYKDGSMNTRISGASQGLAGGQMTHLLAALPYFIGRRPDIICLQYGYNDVEPDGLNAAQVIASFDAAITQITNAGIWVVVDEICAMDASRIPDGDPRLTAMETINAWIMAQEGRPGVKPNKVSDTFGWPRPNQPYWLRDGLHKQDRGAYAAALRKLAILQTMVSPGDYRDHNPANGNVMPNATYAGTAGTKGTGITGSVATNCDVSRTAGVSTIIASKEASDVVGCEKQVLTITPVADATTVHKLSMRQTSNVTIASRGLAIGDWLVAMQYLELSAWDYWVRAHWNIFLSTGTLTKWSTIIARSNGNTGVHVLPTGGYGLWMESDCFQIPAGFDIDTLRVGGGVTNAMLNLEWLGAASGSGICKVSKPILRKISDPRPRWGL